MIDLLKIVILFLLSFVLSTLLIRRGIPRLKSDSSLTEPLPESTSSRLFDFRATGLWIGFCETLLVFVLVYKGEFSALAIIIGAKEFVRKEKIQQNPSYYLLGTLINLSVSVLFALVAKSLRP
jgi:hypothetical protein